jgi:hypothetical protein
VGTQGEQIVAKFRSRQEYETWKTQRLTPGSPSDTAPSMASEASIASVWERSAQAVLMINAYRRSRPASFRLIVSALVLALAIIGSTLAYRQYRASVLSERLTEIVGRDAGYMETILKIDQEAANITYKELFDLCDKSIENRTTLIVELRGLHPNVASILRESLVEYLGAENELVRAKRNLYRKQLAFSSKLDTFTDHVRDVPTSSYGWGYYLRRGSALREDMLRLVADMDDSAVSYSATYLRLLDLETRLAPEMDGSGVRFTKVFAKYQAENMRLAEEARKTADAIRQQAI